MKRVGCSMGDNQLVVADRVLGSLGGNIGGADQAGDENETAAKEGGEKQESIIEFYKKHYQ